MAQYGQYQAPMAAPSYGSYSAAPTYSAPAVRVEPTSYEIRSDSFAAPSYSAPAAPAYSAPAVRVEPTSYEIRTDSYAAPSYSAPAAPAYSAPAYSAPATPAYSAPSYGARAIVPITRYAMNSDNYGSYNVE